MTQQAGKKFYYGSSSEGFHKLAYREWGDPENPRVLMCVHGVTRNGRDFDFLARYLAADFRVVCPDLLGRGDSHYVGSTILYNFTQYMSDLVALMARTGGEEFHLLGSSLGGVISMMLAAQPHAPIHSLILNDIGMTVPGMALQRIATYARNDHEFTSREELTRYFKTILSNFGHDHPELWEHITTHGARPTAAGRWRLAYDPAIGHSFLHDGIDTLHLESYWQKITCPILVLRGEESDVLTPDTLRRMKIIQPHTDVVEIPGVGHTPSLMVDFEIDTVAKWLLSRACVRADLLKAC